MRLTRKYLTFILICMLSLLAACTGQPQLPIQQPALEGEGPATSPPLEVPAKSEPAAPKTAPPQDKPGKSGSASKPGVGCSPASLEQSVLLAKWDRQSVSYVLSPIDASSGQALCDYKAISAGRNYNSYAFSPDSSSLAVIVSNKDDHSDGALHLIDLRHWQQVSTSIAFNSWVMAMAFSPDGEQLAIAQAGPHKGAHGWPAEYRLVVVDVASQSIAAETGLEIAPRLLQFTPDGASLVVYGPANQNRSGIDAEARALLLNTADLSPSWETVLNGVLDGQTRLYGSDNSERYMWWGPGVAYSPQQQILYVVHADEDRLSSVDFASRSLASVEIRPAMSWFERLLAFTAGVAKAKVVDGTTKQAALSADGQMLYIVSQTNATIQDERGNWQLEQTSHGLQIVDPATGLEIARLDSEATDLALSSDGKKLYLRGWTSTWASTAWSEILDLDRLKVENRLAGRHLLPGRRLDGAPVLLSQNPQSSGNTALAIVDLESPHNTIVFSATGYAIWLLP